MTRVRTAGLRLVLALALGGAAAVGLAAARPTPASACGGPTVLLTADEEAVLTVVNDFFSALARGDADAALASWTKNGEVRAMVPCADCEAGGLTVVARRKVRDAVRRWIAHPPTWNVEAYSVDASGKTATVTLYVWWKTRQYRDTLSLVRRGEAWKVARKDSTLLPDVNATAGGQATAAGY